ncbi:MAG: UTP--glucose-1-phosphate uridylyltransferase, partial [Candidatus Omnitrophota bacterium]
KISIQDHLVGTMNGVPERDWDNFDEFLKNKMSFEAHAVYIFRYLNEFSIEDHKLNPDTMNTLIKFLYLMYKINKALPDTDVLLFTPTYGRNKELAWILHEYMKSINLTDIANFSPDTTQDSGHVMAAVRERFSGMPLELEGRQLIFVTVEGSEPHAELGQLVQLPAVPAASSEALVAEENAASEKNRKITEMLRDWLRDLLDKIGIHSEAGLVPNETQDKIANLALDQGLALLASNIQSGVITEKVHIDMIELLLELEQGHLFKGWDEPGINDDKKIEFLNQLVTADKNYPGGFKKYRENAGRLIEISQEGKNPFEGLTPKVPQGLNLTEMDDNFRSMEQKGLEAANKLSFVMVAGGLGERLGYDGIKVGIPLSLATEETYLELYVKKIMAIQKRSNRLNSTNDKIPLVIMTSGLTHDETIKLLEKNDYYSRHDMKRDQIIIVKQELVPAIANSNCDFCLEKDNPYNLETKPHGHGDIHMLLTNQGIVDKWVAEGRTHTIFIQDTNGQVVNSILAGLGASIENGYDFNFLTVPRDAGEKAGAITELVAKDGKATIGNVEYNQLGPLLKATVNPEGDVPDPETGKSPYPGNLNIFIIRNSAYLPVLHATGGIIAEFVNPKYANEQKTEFKSPTRLETMMQDLAPNMGAEAQVGFTNFQKRDVFSPVKNDMATGAENPTKGNYPDSMPTGEADYYKYGRKLLAMAGVDVNVEGKERKTRGVPYSEGAKVVLSPSFATTSIDVSDKIKGGTISDNSTLIIDGEDINIEDINLNGTLVIKTAPGVKLTINSLDVENEGWRFVDLTDEEMVSEKIPTYQKIRGYKILKEEQHVIEITEPGEYVIEDGELRKTSIENISIPQWKEFLPRKISIAVSLVLAGVSGTVLLIKMFFPEIASQMPYFNMLSPVATSFGVMGPLGVAISM